MGGILVFSLITGIVIYTAWYLFPYIDAKVKLYLLRNPSTNIVDLDKTKENQEIISEKQREQVDEKLNSPFKVLEIVRKFIIYYGQKIFSFFE